MATPRGTLTPLDKLQWEQANRKTAMKKGRGKYLNLGRGRKGGGLAKVVIVLLWVRMERMGFWSTEAVAM